MDRKICTEGQVKIMSVGNGSFGKIQGYASTFANFDKVNERPVKGAFSGTLTKFRQDGFIAVGHDWNTLPVATVTDAFEDDHGLFLEAEFHSTPLAQEARTIAQERVDRGKSVSLSIGYEVKADEYVEEGRLLKEIDLFEVSLVNVPANPLATVTGVKSLLQASMPLDSHSEVAQAAIEGYMKRLVALSMKGTSTGTKEGRVLSGQNRTKLSDLHTSLADVMQVIEELLAATEPRASEEETAKARTQFLRLITRQRALLSVIRSN